MKTTKSIAFIAIFLALIIGSQFALSFAPNIEIVTLLFAVFFYSFGVKRGLILSTAFSVIRCFIFGFYPTVIILYLVYYSIFAVVVGLIGRKFNRKYSVKSHIILIVTVCLLTCLFTLLDDVITPLFYGIYSDAFVAYFISSLPFMLTQVICSFVSITFVFPFLLKIMEKLNF